MRKKVKDKVIEELISVPIVTIACDKHGISRQTFYRWKNEDKDFKDKVNNSLGLGVESINDLAESIIIKNIKSGDMGAVKYWLNNNKYNYIRPRDKEFFDKVNLILPDKPKRKSKNEIESIKVEIVKPENIDNTTLN